MSTTVVTFGEIMMRLSPPGFQRFRQAARLELTFGGGEANVAASLANFGVNARFVTRLPDNELGDACERFLLAQKVDTRAIVHGGERLGIYFLEAGAAQRGSQVIYDRSHSAFADIQPGMVDWENVFAGAKWFHWSGITPAVSRGAAEALQEALKAARRKGITISCDLNYRRKLWKWGSPAGEVMQDLVKYCDVIVGNEEDAEQVFGIHAPGADVTAGRLEPDRYEAVTRCLRERFPGAHTVAITLRGSLSASRNTWAAVLDHQNKFYSSMKYDVYPIVDRVGAGDAFCAGLIYALLSDTANIQRALDFAAAASCLKHSIQGDVNLAAVSEVEKLMAGDASGRVSR